MKPKPPPPCPCGSGSDYAHCCQPYVTGETKAPSAVALMRSRYTAYTLQNNDYIQKTWHTTTRPDLSARSSEPVKWTGLTVLSHEQEARSALVEFIARYKINGRAERLHERSRFVLEDGQWFYVDGEHLK